MEKKKEEQKKRSEKKERKRKKRKIRVKEKIFVLSFTVDLIDVSMFVKPYKILCLFGCHN